MIQGIQLTHHDFNGEINLHATYYVQMWAKSGEPINERRFALVIEELNEALNAQTNQDENQ